MEVDIRDVGLIPFHPGKIPWRRKWKPTSVFLPGESHGQSLEGYSLWGHKESDTTEELNNNKDVSQLFFQGASIF